MVMEYLLRFLGIKRWFFTNAVLNLGLAHLYHACSNQNELFRKKGKGKRIELWVPTLLLSIYQAPTYREIASKRWYL